MNPYLFGENSGMPAQNTAFMDLASIGPLPLFDDPQGLGSTPDSGIAELTEKIEKLRYEAQEALKSVGLKNDRLTQRMQTIEGRFGQIIQEINERQTYIMSRIKDRQMGDLKVEALIERHNQIVQSFDLRLTQAQRVIENQSLQLGKQQELIDDARRQIEKLKKL